MRGIVVAEPLSLSAAGFSLGNKKTIIWQRSSPNACCWKVRPGSRGPVGLEYGLQENQSVSHDETMSKHLFRNSME